MWSTVSLTGRQIQASRATRRRSTHPGSEQPTTAELEANLKRLIHSAISPGSRKTYEQAWNHFLDFSTRYCGTAFPQLPLSVSDITLFVAYLSAKKLAASTISTYISALSYVHKIGSFSDPTKAFVVQKIMTAQSRLCSKPDIRLPITRSILLKLVLALSHTITSASHILLFQTMFLVAFYGLFWVGELTIKTLERRHSVLQFQSLSFLNSQSEVQATKLVISDQHNTTGPGFLFSIIIRRDSAVQFCPVEFLLRWCRMRRSNTGSHFCLADGSAVKTEIFTQQLKHGSPCFLWFRLFQLQIALFSYWCS